MCVHYYVQLKAIQMQKDEVGHKQEKRKKEITDLEAKVCVVYAYIHTHVHSYVYVHACYAILPIVLMKESTQLSKIFFLKSQ